MTSQTLPQQPQTLPQQPQSSMHKQMSPTKKVVALIAAVALGAGVYTHGQHTTTKNPKAMAQEAAWNSTSNNWSGYAETTAQTGQKFTSVAGEWVVPAVSTMQSTNRVGCAALWTGIGGATSKDLIQLGTDSCSNSSQTGYYAWYEILPASGTPIQSLAIQPGDRVYAALQLVSGGTGQSTQAATANYATVTQLIDRYDPSFGTSNIIERLRQLLADGQARLESQPWWPRVSTELRQLLGTPAPSNAQVWKLTFNVTSPSGAVQTWTKTLSYSSSLSSAEWITEAPTASSGVEPLPNYGVAHFLGAAANGSIPSFSPANQIVLGDPSGQASVPSPPVGKVDSFNTCYFPTYHVSACPAPGQG